MSFVSAVSRHPELDSGSIIVGFINIESIKCLAQNDVTDEKLLKKYQCRFFYFLFSNLIS